MAYLMLHRHRGRAVLGPCVATLDAGAARLVLQPRTPPHRRPPV
jgi:hypothetical protein